VNGHFQSGCDRSSSEQHTTPFARPKHRDFKDGFKLPDNSTDKSVAFALHKTTISPITDGDKITNQRQACKRPLPIRERPFSSEQHTTPFARPKHRDFKDGFKLPDNSTDKSVAIAFTTIHHLAN